MFRDSVGFRVSGLKKAVGADSRQSPPENLNSMTRLDEDKFKAATNDKHKTRLCYIYIYIYYLFIYSFIRSYI